MYRPVPAKPDFNALEESVLALWDKTRAFDQLRARNANGPIWSFIDGPITANNPMGVHHAWGRTYKDIFQRYKAMQGFRQRYQNGFDCQGLWVEVEVEKELGFNSKREIEAFGLEAFSRACRERVYRYADTITRQSIRLGQWMDWDDSYYTLSDNNIQHIWTFLKTCHERGWLYKGARSMPWCIRCETGLSQHELVGTDAYAELTHTSVYIALPIQERPGEYFLVWTTTPWTLAANVALAVHPALEYVKARQGDRVLILSAGALHALQGPYEEVGRVPGRELVGLTYRGPFDEFESQQGVVHRVIAWEEVGETEGTGIVHIAPGCGAEDYELSKVENLPVLVPLDEAGNYVPGYGMLSDRNVREVNPLIFASLRDKGLLERLEEYTHRYPTCWRCKSELVFRLSEEWYISVDEIRPRMKRAADTVCWVPPSAGKRMQDWLDNMGDWNISRRRYWGLPLPFYPCAACGELTVIGSLQELRERALSGLEHLSELHRPWIDEVVIACARCGAPTRRITEVGDAWLDAGIVPFSTLYYLQDPAYWRQWFPADFITEMREQIRLWFYSMLFMSVALEDRSPYQAVLAYEKLMDEHGEPMHRSKGNAIWFDEAVERMGADVMRWMYASQNITQNLLFGYTPAREVTQKLLTLWNVYAFFVLYAREDRFVPAPERHVPHHQRALLDRWILSRFAALVAAVRETLDNYDPGPATVAVERFVDDLSTWYVRRSRRRFWKSANDRDKWAAYQTLYEVLVGLVRLLAPIMPFLTEELYQNLVRSVDPSAPDSVHLTDYPVPDEAARDTALEQAVDLAREIVALGRAARSAAQIRVRQPLAKLLVRLPDRQATLDPALVEEIADELNVKQVELVGDLGYAVQQVATPRPELLGPKYGRRYPEISKALREGRFTVLPGGRVAVEGVELEPGEVTLSTRGLPGYQVEEADGILVALDTTLTEPLVLEGQAREIVRHIQDLRKEAGFEVADRIVVGYETLGDHAGLREAITTHRDYIARETLAVDLHPGVDETMERWSGEIDGAPLTLGVRRVATR